MTTTSVHLEEVEGLSVEDQLPTLIWYVLIEVDF